eukprot:CAMPEP_0119531790 /NCGR_PEP_ID=MMETSP1344-20130328/45425_1 /TAXON_ID=236787 /ORGANISM="Florenciella parvula, Strain CCMP2471" /LENGTH=200 /DNA_ID=CAMNT_0007572131 /DNA_START=297 /DNA_END=896 /DNA_ORIENTATION=+
MKIRSEWTTMKIRASDAHSDLRVPRRTATGRLGPPAYPPAAHSAAGLTPVRMSVRPVRKSGYAPCSSSYLGSGQFGANVEANQDEVAGGPIIALIPELQSKGGGLSAPAPIIWNRRIARAKAAQTAGEPGALCVPAASDLSTAHRRVPPSPSSSAPGPRPAPRFKPGGAASAVRARPPVHRTHVASPVRPAPPALRAPAR